MMKIRTERTLKRFVRYNIQYDTIQYHHHRRKNRWGLIFLTVFCDFILCETEILFMLVFMLNVPL